LTGGAADLDDPHMAKKTHVTITDDLDGSENAQTVSFGFEGLSYEVDLAKKNKAELQKAPAPFIEAGRKVSTHPRRRGTDHGRPGGSSVDRGAVRAWAAQNGIQVAERGRISADVLERYRAAH
jgi:Lsr2